MITFLNPNLLFLIPLVFVVLFYLYFLKESKKNNFEYFSDLVSVYKSNTFYYKIYYFLLFIVSIFFILVLSFPIRQIDEDNIKRDLFDIRIVFDISYSMLATDLEPSRISLSKNSLEDFLSEIKYSRIGLTVFSGLPYELVKPTINYKDVISRIHLISPYLVDQNISELQGSNLGGALLSGASNFDGDNNIIILFTDGGANKGYSLPETVKYLRDKGVRVFVIGLGKRESTFVDIYDPEFSIYNKVEVLGLDEETLRNLALFTGGDFYRIDDSNLFGNILREIYNSELKRLNVKEYIDLRIYFILAFLFSLFLTLYYRFTKLKNL